MQSPTESSRGLVHFCKLGGVAALLMAAFLLAQFIGRATEQVPPALGTEAQPAEKAEAYLQQLRALEPKSWLEEEFRRQRSFPFLARSRRLVAGRQYDQAVRELEGYLATHPDDLAVEFEYLLLTSNLKREHQAIGAADRILAVVPTFAPARFYRGLARATLGDHSGAWADLATAVDSGALMGGDSQFALRSLAMAALADPKPPEALAVLDREAAKRIAEAVLPLAKGQLLERLGRRAKAAGAYDEATRRAGNAEDIRAAWVFGAQLALKRGDTVGALSRSQAAWKLSPGNPQVAKVLAAAAAQLGRSDLVESVARRSTSAGELDRPTRESLANSLFQVGRFGEAAAGFDELAQSAQSETEEYRLRLAAGFAAQAGKDAARALVEFQRAAAIRPSPEALSAAADAAMQMGRLDLAVTDLGRLAEATKGSDRAEALQRLSIVEEKTGKLADALAALDQIDGSQRDSDIERRSFFLAAKLGNSKRAVAYAERLATLQSTGANWRALAEAEIAAGQPGDAVRSLKTSLAKGRPMTGACAGCSPTLYWPITSRRSLPKSSTCWRDRPHRPTRCTVFV